jgi:hypothetical protein
MSLKDKLIKVAFGKFQLSIDKFKGFLKKPATLLALKIAAGVLLSEILSIIQSKLGKSISDKEALDYVKNSRELQKFMGVVGDDLDESYLNEILLTCENPEYYEDDLNDFLKSIEGKDLSGEDYIDLFNKSGEFDIKTKNLKKTKSLLNVISKIEGIAPWAFLVYVLVIKIKEFLEQNENPSPHRGKYLQRIIRVVGSILKQIPEKSKKESEYIKMLVGSLKLMDAIVVGSLFASAIYLRNRKAMQKDAIKTFQEIASAQLCEPVTEPTIPEIISIPLIEDLNNCPVDIDDNIVPHIPIEDKLETLSCEIEQIGDPEEGKSRTEIASKALFENQSSIDLKILVKPGDEIHIDVPMATYDGDKVYPSVSGIIEKIEPNKIYVKDISDSPTYLEELIVKLNDAYKEQNDTKFFINEFYIPSIYPVMLKYSPLIDGKLSTKESLSLFYKTGGVKKRWDGIKKDFEKQIKDWNKRNKDIAKSDNVKKKAEAEKMDDIRIEMEASEKILFKYLKSDGAKGINESKITKADEKEFELVEFYFLLVSQLLGYFDKNDIATSMINKMSEFLSDRFFIDKYSVDKIKNKINSYCLNLSQGTFFSMPPNFYKILKQKWDNSNLQPGQRFASGEAYLIDLQKNNKKQTDSEKENITKYILFLFNFSIETDKLIAVKYSPEKTKWLQTELEGNWIEDFFASLWKRYDALPKEIISIFNEIEDIAKTFSTYSIININGEQYRWYSIAEDSCEPPEEDDPYLSPKSKKGYGDIGYWLRYCSFATLASVANPATSWSTGLPPPLGPIPFPTVYIPAKAFQTPWGFIVIGLTITGIYPLPLALFVNWSTEHHVPLADPTTLMKREIEALKKELSDQLNQFKKDRLKSYLDKAKEDIKSEETTIKALQNEKTKIKLEKPKRDRSIEPKKDMPRYSRDLLAWTEKRNTNTEVILSSKKSKASLEVKYKIIKVAYDGGSIGKNPDAKIQALQNTEDKINKQFDNLDKLIDNRDSFVAPLPIATKPETANFAFTLKNPKPIIKMASDIDQNINYGPLDKIIEKFEPKNEDLMKTNYGPVSVKTFNNFKAYKTALKVAMPTIIKSDPFPKYENLKPENLPWMTFLSKEWAPTGAKTYGFPGFPPIPIG